MSSTLTIREILADAIRYWEIRRIGYNIALALIVVVYFMLGLPHSRDQLSIDGTLVFFLLAVLANVAYCTAYVVDVFAQLSAARLTWLRIRWLLFVVGLLFAAVVTRFIVKGVFGVAP